MSENCPSTYWGNSNNHYECELPFGHSGSHRNGPSGWDDHLDKAGFARLSLPARMRLAADVLEEAAKRGELFFRTAWTPSDLRIQANRWEEEEVAQALKDQQVEDLSVALFNTLHANGFNYHNMAQTLIDNGWTKVTPNA